jgi:hypothetical protein
VQDRFFDENLEEIQKMVVYVYRHFLWRKNDWKWLSDKGLMLLLDISTPHDKSLVRAALEWLAVKQKTCSYLGALSGKQRSKFYLMPPPVEWLQPMIEDLKKQCHHQKCKQCGAVIPISKNHLYCADCDALRKAEKEARKQKRKQTPKPKTCIICGVSFAPTARNQKCCSAECSVINKRQYNAKRSK